MNPSRPFGPHRRPPSRPALRTVPGAPASTAPHGEPGAPRTNAHDLVIVAALVGYLIREPLASAILYYVSGTPLSVLWYVPDLLAGLCIILFLTDLIGRGAVVKAFLTVAVLGFAMAVGFLVTNKVTAVVAGLKLAIPLFVGFLAREDLLDRRAVRLAALFAMVISMVGIQYSALGSLPWDNADFDIFGRTKAAKDIVYMYGERRLSGFVGDAHAAAFCVVAPLMLLYRNRRDWSFNLVVPIALYVVFMTLSRTTLMSLVMFVALCKAIDWKLLRSVRLANAVVLSTCIAIIVIPAVIMAWAATTNESEVSYELRSLWARGHDSWVEPFALMGRLAPFAWLHGYGIGGIGYPLYMTDLDQYYVPVDNFHLYNFLSFGLFYGLAYVAIVRSVVTDVKIDRKMLFTTLSFFSMFLLGYGNPLFLLLYAATFRGVFFPSPRETLPSAVPLRGFARHLGTFRDRPAR